MEVSSQKVHLIKEETLQKHHVKCFRNYVSPFASSSNILLRIEILQFRKVLKV